MYPPEVEVAGISTSSLYSSGQNIKRKKNNHHSPSAEGLRDTPKKKSRQSEREGGKSKAKPRPKPRGQNAFVHNFSTSLRAALDTHNVRTLKSAHNSATVEGFLKQMSKLEPPK